LRGAGGNYDFADDAENGRIRLCIDAGSRRSLNEKRNGRSGDSCVPSGRSQKISARGERSRIYRAASCFFRVIREIAVPTDPGAMRLNAKPDPAVSQYTSAQS